MQTVIKRFLLLISLVITPAIMLLCTETPNPFQDISNVDLIISVLEKEGGFNHCINEEVKFKVKVLLPHLVKKIEVNFGENGETDEREITTNKSENKELYFDFKYKETGLKSVLFTIRFRDSGEKREISHSIDIGRLPKIRHGGNLVTTGDMKPGKRLVLTVEHEEYSSTTYKWYKDKALLEETEKQSVIFDPLKESDAGEYYCFVITKWGEEKSKIFILNFKNYIIPPKILIHPQDVQATPGNSATFLIHAEGEAIEYQWQKNKENISGAVDYKYEVVNLNMGDDAIYRCIVSNKGGADTSANASLGVINNETPPQITKQPENREVFEEDMVQFTIEAKGTNLKYKWFKNENEIENAVSAMLEIGPVSIDDNGAKVHCIVYNNQGEVASNEAVLHIRNVEKPIITAHPKDISVKVGHPATFEVKAKGDKLKYQWFGNGDPIDLASDNLYIIESPSLDDNGKKFKCTVENLGGKVYSHEVTLTVVKEVTKPVITDQPGNNGVTVTEGNNAVFEINVSGDDLTFQWWKGDEKIDGANGSKYIHKNVKIGDDGLKFYCVVSNKAGDKVTSDKIVLKVSKEVIAPSISSQPEECTAKEDGKAEFKIEAKGTDLKYQWYKNGKKISGEDQSTLTISSVDRDDNNTKYLCVVKNSAGEEVKSKEAVLIVEFPPSIKKGPSDVGVEAGNEATFSIEVEEGNPENTEFQWYDINGKRVGDGKRKLVINATNVDDGKQYKCEVSNDAGKEMSGTAELSVYYIEITKQPRNQSADVGDNVTFKIAAEGNPGLKYKWKKKGSNRELSTQKSLEIKNIDTDDAGEYYCEVYNDEINGKESAAVELEVNSVPPKIIKQPSLKNNELEVGADVRLEVMAEGTDIKFQWLKNGRIILNADENKYSFTVSKDDHSAKYQCKVYNDTYPDGKISNSVTIKVKIKITITFDMKGGDNSEPAITTFKGKTITLPGVPTKKNSIFKGWNDGSKTYGANKSYEVDSDNDIEFEAIWEDKGKYTIRFYNTNEDAYYKGLVKDAEYYEGEDVDLTGLKSMFPNRWEFKGWRKDSDNGDIITKYTMPSNHVEIYASWIPKKYKIEFTSDYPPFRDKVKNSIGEKSVTAENPYIDLPKNPVPYKDLEEHMVIFTGWKQLSTGTKFDEGEKVFINFSDDIFIAIFME